jgi:hypothetical protein
MSLLLMLHVTYGLHLWFAHKQTNLHPLLVIKSALHFTQPVTCLNAYAIVGWLFSYAVHSHCFIRGVVLATPVRVCSYVH